MAKQTAKRGRRPDGAPRVRPQADRDRRGRLETGLAPRRPARGPGRVVGVVGRAIDAVGAVPPDPELGDVGHAERDGAGLAHAAHDVGVGGRDVVATREQTVALVKPCNKVSSLGAPGLCDRIWVVYLARGCPLSC